MKDFKHIQEKNLKPHLADALSRRHLGRTLVADLRFDDGTIVRNVLVNEHVDCEGVVVGGRDGLVDLPVVFQKSLVAALRRTDGIWRWLGFRRWFSIG